MRVTIFTHGGSALISRLVVAPEAHAETRPAPVTPQRRRRLSSKARAILASGLPK